MGSNLLLYEVGGWKDDFYVRGIVASASRRTLPSVAVEDSNLMVEMVFERRSSRSLG